MAGWMALAAGAGALGNVWSARAANNSNEHMARQQMGFQREMSDTSYQRSVKDLKAAGLNPMLAYTNGGASSPPGSSYQAQSERVGDVASSAVDAIRNQKVLDEADSRIRLNDSTSAKQDVDTQVTEARLGVARAQAAYDLKRLGVDDKFAEADAVGSRVGKVLNSAKDFFNPFKFSSGRSSSDSTVEHTYKFD